VHHFANGIYYFPNGNVGKMRIATFVFPSNLKLDYKFFMAEELKN
jgi:hypothetical protein